MENKNNKKVSESVKRLSDELRDVLEELAWGGSKGSACFTGHRKMKDDEGAISDKLYSLLERLYDEESISDFYAGGAVGFDTVAAKCVLKLRENHKYVKLHLILPCSNEEQTRNLTASQKNEFNDILKRADSVEYTSPHYYRGCMSSRNKRLVECAEDCCICYYDSTVKSGTAQTVELAKKKGLKIYDLFERRG